MKNKDLQIENLQKALGIFLEAMRMYIRSIMQKEYGKLWDQEYYDGLTDTQKHLWDQNIQGEDKPAQNMIDYGNLAMFCIKQKKLLKEDFGRDTNNLATMFNQIADARNMLAHFDAFDQKKYDIAFLQMSAIAHKLGMKELEEDLDALREPIADGTGVDKAASASPKDSTNAWFNIVKPHFDIRQGNLDESVFAADLAEVALGTGREVYSNPATFFSKTYFTSGLRNLATRVVKGLNGEQDADYILCLKFNGIKDLK